MDERSPAVVRQADTPTTTDSLPRGLLAVAARLLDRAGGITLQELAREARVFFSSSAKGGLRIAAIGLVPELTLDVARITAFSAGARVVGSFCYALTRKHVEELEQLCPDIILFTGGTDGGNERYNLRNAEMLRDSSLGGTIVYAGNASIADRVMETLSGKKALVAENVMPDIGAMNVEPARELIREIFLDEIVRGKGLSDIVERTGASPKPTPLGVFELIEAISQEDASWRDFGAMDMGGATTDFYSNSEPTSGDPSVVLRGVEEPRVKRTVEGDLGMRVSAAALYETAGRYIVTEAEKRGHSKEAVEEFVRRVHAHTEFRPESDVERELDLILAKACVRHATARHAGRVREVFTPTGKVYVQRGKDLRRIKRIIGTGGYLARCEDAEVYEAATAADPGGEERALLPESPEHYRDSAYLFPLLGNVVAAHRRAAVTIALNSLKKVPSVCKE